MFDWIKKQMDDLETIGRNLTTLKQERYLEIMDELGVARNKEHLMRLYANTAADQCRRAEEAYTRCCERVRQLEKLAKELR